MYKYIVLRNAKQLNCSFILLKILKVSPINFPAGTEGRAGEYKDLR